MTPDKQKVFAIPHSSQCSRFQTFLGLASYYRQYISKFSDIAWPLHHLTQKDVMFTWGATQTDAFKSLKKALIEVPVLSYPRFDANAPMFVLQTDASSVGLGAVLEQYGSVIAYGSRALNSAEKYYRKNA